MRTTITLLFLLLISGLICAQNLVPNSSFETYTVCPNSRNDGILPANWAQPTTGTSDYYNACVSGNGSNKPDVPTNFMGTQNARTGNAYMGLYTNIELIGTMSGYREYMQIELDQYLYPGIKYDFEMYVSLADESQFAANNLGVYLSAIKIGANTNVALPVTPQITFTGFVTDKNNWTKISATYTAIGGERFITIGCFSTNNAANLQAVQGGSGGGWNKMCYYYVDDVTLTPNCSEFSNRTNIALSLCTKPSVATSLSSNLSGLSYLWSTGATSPSISTTQSGLYWVKTELGPCWVLDTFILNRTNYPIANLPADTGVCTNALLPIKINAQIDTGQTYLWNTGDTTSFLWVDQAGSYFIKTTRYNCSSYDTINVVPKSPPTFDLGKDTLLCYGQHIILTSKIPNAFHQWNNGSNQTSIQVVDGLVWLTETLNGCSFTDSISVSQKNNPGLNLGPDTAICPYSTISFSAASSHADTYRWHDNSILPFYSQVGGGVIWVTLSKESCFYTDSILVQNAPLPTVDLGPNLTICNGDSTTLQLPPNSTPQIDWSTGDTHHQLTIMAPIKLWIKVTGSNGCFSTDTIQIDTFPQPSISLGPNDTFCLGATYLLRTSVNFNSYLWNTGNTAAELLTDKAGTYSLTVKDNNGCSTSDTITLFQFPLPVLTDNRLVVACRIDTSFNVSGSFQQIRWDDGSSLNSRSVNTPGLYVLEVTDTNQCVFTQTFELKSNCPPIIFVPNVFSPNNDGTNDLFTIITDEVVSYELKIYNRWGALVYQTNDSKEFWNGSHNGKIAPDDVYVWVITYEDNLSKTHTLHGQVTIIR